jgi:transcriptional regulator with XRE-family HTH domain
VTLGEHIRLHRLRKGLTGSELARRAGVSRSLVSQVERGGLSPSIEVLRRIALALELQAGALFDGVDAPGSVPRNGTTVLGTGQRRARVVRRQQRKVLGLPAAHVRYELLSPDLQGRLEFVRMEVHPGQVMPTAGWSHAGEESILILEGGVAYFQYGDERFTLEEGDTITFDSSVPHLLANPGERVVVAISAGTPPSF